MTRSYPLPHKIRVDKAKVTRLETETLYTVMKEVSVTEHRTVKSIQRTFIHQKKKSLLLKNIVQELKRGTKRVIY